MPTMTTCARESQYSRKALHKAFNVASNTLIDQAGDWEDLRKALTIF